jgi:hypothetical protein
VRLAALLAASLLLPAGETRTDGGSAAPRAGDRLQLERVRGLVAHGHAFLIDQQNADGSFSIVRSTRSKSAPVAVTALSALSLMAAGNLPDRGRYEAATRRAVEWLVDHCNDEGYFTTDRDGVSRMHGQGYALLALTQAWGMYDAESGQRARMRGAIERGVQLIEASQGDTGGWYYDPRRVSDHEGSITVCMVQALRAARDTGFRVDKGVIDRALVYLDKSQDKSDGRFRYRINDPKKSWALTAAALSTLNALGDYGSNTLELGFEALQRSDPLLGQASSEPFQDYGSLYAAQAYWHWRDQRAFDLWWPEFVADCASRQQEDGSFYDGDFGSVYATAIVTLTLQVPLGFLPVFQR